MDERRGFGGGPGLFFVVCALDVDFGDVVVLMDLSWLVGRICVFEELRRAEGLDGRVGGGDLAGA